MITFHRWHFTRPILRQGPPEAGGRDFATLMYIPCRTQYDTVQDEAFTQGVSGAVCIEEGDLSCWWCACSGRTSTSSECVCYGVV